MQLLTVGSGTACKIHPSYQGAAASVQKQFALQLQELLAPAAKGTGQGNVTRRSA